MCSFTCFRWMFWLTPSTLKLLNQVRPGTGEKQGESVLRTHVKVNRKVSKPATLIKKNGGIPQSPCQCTCCVNAFVSLGEFAAAKSKGIIEKLQSEVQTLHHCHLSRK